MVEIYYNGINAFSGVSPTPFMSVSNDFIDYATGWNQITNITLEGTLTGEYLGPASYRFLNKSLDRLNKNFSQNFKNLYVVEDGKTIYSGECAVIKSINIDQSNWYGLVPYTIELSVMNQELFQNYYSIVDPSDEISYEEDQNDIVSYTRTVSAIGVTTPGNNGITNAKNWVDATIAIQPNIQTIFVKDNGHEFLLESSNEVIDRFNGSYSKTNVYKKSTHPDAIDGAILNYSVDITYNESDGYVYTRIDGSLNGNNISTLYDKYSTLDLFSICSDLCFKATGKLISSRIISKSIKESPDTKEIAFSCEYNDDTSPDIINDINVTIDQDLLKCNASVRVTNNISCRYGSVKERWLKVLNAYKDFNPYIYAEREYRNELNAILPTIVKSESLTHDELNAQIQCSTEYSDEKSIPGDNLNLITSMNSTVSYTPCVVIHSSNTSAFTPREHNVQYLGVSQRSKVTIAVSAISKVISSQAESERKSYIQNIVQSEINRLRSNYVVGSSIKQEGENTTWRDSKEYERSETWTFEGQIYT